MYVLGGLPTDYRKSNPDTTVFASPLEHGCTTCLRRASVQRQELLLKLNPFNFYTLDLHYPTHIKWLGE
jgi:hypothetical protein